MGSRRNEYQMLIEKYQTEIVLLEEAEEDLNRRITALEELVPQVLVWYMWKVSQSGKPLTGIEDDAQAKLLHLENLLEELRQADATLKHEEMLMRKNIEELEAKIESHPAYDYVGKSKVADKEKVANIKNDVAKDVPLVDEDIDARFKELLRDPETDWQATCKELLTNVSDLTKALQESNDRFKTSENYIKQLEKDYSEKEKIVSKKVDDLEKQQDDLYREAVTKEQDNIKQEEYEKEVLSTVKEVVEEVKSIKQSLIEDAPWPTSTEEESAPLTEIDEMVVPVKKSSLRSSRKQSSLTPKLLSPEEILPTGSRKGSVASLTSPPQIFEPLESLQDTRSPPEIKEIADTTSTGKQVVSPTETEQQASQITETEEERKLYVTTPEPSDIAPQSEPNQMSETSSMKQPEQLESDTFFEPDDFPKVPQDEQVEQDVSEPDVTNVKSSVQIRDLPETSSMKRPEQLEPDTFFEPDDFPKVPHDEQVEQDVSEPDVTNVKSSVQIIDLPIDEEKKSVSTESEKQPPEPIIDNKDILIEDPPHKPDTQVISSEEIQSTDIRTSDITVEYQQVQQEIDVSLLDKGKPDMDVPAVTYIAEGIQPDVQESDISSLSGKVQPTETAFDESNTPEENIQMEQEIEMIDPEKEQPTKESDDTKIPIQEHTADDGTGPPENVEVDENVQEDQVANTPPTEEITTRISKGAAEVTEALAITSEPLDIPSSGVLLQPTDSERELQHQLTMLKGKPSADSLAAKTLQGKCRVKDHLIKSMADQLRELAKKNVWSGNILMDNISSDPVKTYDFDRTTLFQYLKGEEPKNFAVSLSSNESYSTKNPLNVKVLKKLDMDSLLIEWGPPPSQEVVGFQIFVNGAFMYWVYSAARNKALLHPLDLTTEFDITVSPVNADGEMIYTSSMKYTP